MYCQHCGALHLPEAFFCPKCGTHVTSPVLQPAMLETHEKEAQENKEENPNERLVLFSDGVAAIAATLGVVTIKISPDPSKLLNQWQSNIGHIFLYVLSFVFVAMYWNEHRHIFHYIKDNNLFLNVLNFCFLASIVTVPIGFYFTEEYSMIINVSASDLGNVILLFLGANLCAGLSLSFMWRYASHRYRLLDSEMSRKHIRYITLRNLTYPLALSIIIITLSVVGMINNVWPLVGIFIFLPVWLVILRRYRKGLDDHPNHYNTGRTLLFSDVVFSIAITSAIIEIVFLKPVDNNGQPVDIPGMWGLFYSYLVGIVILGVIWLFHYRMFRYIKHLDGWLIVLNFCFLLCIAFIYIPIKEFAKFWRDSGKGGLYVEIFLGVNLTLAALIFCLMWRHAARKRHLLDEKVTASQIKLFNIGIVSQLIIFLALTIIPLKFVLSPWQYLLFYLVLLGIVLLTSSRRLNKPGMSVEQEVALHT